MSNIQKSFKNKAKRGLCMAAGGILGEDDPYKGMSAATAAQYTNDPDVLNNANTAKWAAEEAQRQRSHPGQAFLNPVATQDPMAAFAKRLGDTVGDSLFRRFGSSISPAAPAPATVDPAETTFQQDIDARQSRINGLRKRLGGFADGGIVGADGLTDAQRAKLSSARASLGVSNAPPPSAPPAPAAAPAPVRTAPAPTQQPSVGGAINSIRERQRVLSNLATGGVVGAKTFEFEGKGTGTSDDIPVKVAGNHVNVSDGEKAVILPAKTAQNPQALDMIEDVIEQTNGKPPNRGLRDGFNFTKGGFVDDYGNLNPPNRFQNAANNEVLRQQVNNAAPGAQLRPDQTAAMAEKAAANRPAPTAPKTAGPDVMNIAGRAIGAGTHAYSAATSDIPAEQVSHAIKGAAYTAGPWWGTGVDAADALVNKATGGKYNMATGLDAAAKWASDNVPGMRGDYMLPPEFQPGGTGKAAAQPPEAEAPTADEQAANRAALTPTAPQMSTKANFVPEAVASDTPKLDAEVTRRGLSGIKTIGTANGNVTTGRDKNGQLHVMAGLDNTDAQNEALRAKEADRMTKDLARQVQVFDGLRAERLQASPDPAERAMGLAQAQQQILQQQNRNTAAHNEATMADAKEGRSIQRATLEQQNDQFNKTQAAATATAKAAAADAGVKDFDKLVEDSGLPKDEQTPFRDWFRGNYAGRKQKGADGKEVDVPGFEDMSADEKRAHMTNALAQYALVKQLRATEMNGNESMMPPTNLIKRDIEWADVKRNSAGLPVIDSGDPNHPGLLGDKGYLARAWLPKWVGGPGDQVMEEKDPKTGKAIRKWLAENTKGNMGPWGNMDTAAYMEGLQAKK